MAINIFGSGDERVMLEELANSIFKSRTYLVRDIGPKFPKYAKELAAVEADLTVAVDKLYEIMMRSMDEDDALYGREGKN